MSCNKSFPKLEAINIDTSGTSAIINVCGVFPTCGRFNVCLRACREVACSGTPVILCDSEGTYIIAVNVEANKLTLGQATVQASRQGVLHFLRSVDFTNYAVMLDKLACSPTPIITSSSLATQATAKTSKSK